MPLRDSSNPSGVSASETGVKKRNFQLRGASGVYRLVLALALLCAFARRGAGQEAEPQQPAQAPSAFGAINPYVGLTVDEIEFPDVSPEESSALIALTPLKVGEPLTRDALRDAIKALFASGRFSDIQAEAERAQTAGVRIRFLTSANYFVGIVTVDGVSTNPSKNQLVSATRLQLGTLYAQDKVDAALDGMQRVLQENGFHQAKIKILEKRDKLEHQVDITFHVTPGSRATVGQIIVKGDANYSSKEIEDIARLHPGDPVISSRATRALQRTRVRYQKQDRLLAQVSLADRSYRPSHNTVDYTFEIDRGPVVEVASEGYKLSRGTLRRLVPIYEEGAVDDDLLNEGRRNIENHMQGLGYFEATTRVSQQNLKEGKTLRVVYVINPGDRHKLAAIQISGNRYFSDELIRRRMQEQTAGRLLSHGRYGDTDQLLPFQVYLPTQPPRVGPPSIEEHWSELLAAKKLFPLLASLRMDNGVERYHFEVQSIKPARLTDKEASRFQTPENYVELQPRPF